MYNQYNQIAYNSNQVLGASMEFPIDMATSNRLAGYNAQPGIADQQLAEANAGFSGEYPVWAPNSLWNYQVQFRASPQTVAYNNPTTSYAETSVNVSGYAIQTAQQNIYGPFSAVNYNSSPNTAQQQDIYGPFAAAKFGQ